MRCFISISCFCSWLISFLTLSYFQGFSQNLSARERDNLKVKSIVLVKEFEQLLNVLANKSTSPMDAQDLVTMATADEQTRIFASSKVVLEDDLYTINADSASPKDVSVQKYLIDWDLFYTKGYDETVKFSDLRVSEFQNHGYLFIKVFYISQFKNKHRELGRSYKPTRRVASVRFDFKDGKYVGHINGISFFRSKAIDGTNLNQAAIESEFKPFVSEHKIRLGIVLDTAISESQMAQQSRNDSLYNVALKHQIHQSEELKAQEMAFARSISKGDSLLNLRQFAKAISFYSEARAIKPLEPYPRAKINELTNLLAMGNNDPRQMFNKQFIEGDRLAKFRDYEGARQAFQAAYLIMPENQAASEKYALMDKIIRTKAEVRKKYQAGNFRMALREYARLIAEEKSNADWYLERANCYQAMGDPKKALADLNSAIQLDPQFLEAIKMRSFIFQSLKEPAKAMSDLNTLIGLDPKSAEFHQRIGLLHLETNQLEKALTEFDLALSLDAKDVRSAAAKTEVYRKKSNPEMALKAVETALAINPNFSSAIFQKGLIFFQKGELSKATIELDLARSLGLNMNEYLELEKLNQDLMKVAKAKASISPPQTQEAIQFAQKALILVPESDETQYFLATQNWNLGNHKEALALLNKCLQQSRGFLPAWILKGQIFFKLRDFKESKAAFSDAYRLEDRSLEACHGMGENYLALGQYDSALVWYNHAFSIKSSNLTTLVNRGKCHFWMENFTKALLDFENAIRENNGFSEAHFWKGRVNRQLRKPFDAIDNFNEAKRLGYPPFECLMGIGETYAALGNHKQAIKSFSEAILLQPDSMNGFIQRGLSYLELGNFGAAKTDFEKAVSLDAGFSNLIGHLELGFLQIRSADFDGAQKGFSQLLALDTNHPRANYGMGVVLFSLGQKVLGLKHFETAFQTGKIESGAIKKDVWMKEINKDPDFLKLKEAYIK